MSFSDLPDVQLAVYCWRHGSGSTSGRSEILMGNNIAVTELLRFLIRSYRIRIIYISERIQLHTKYCCCARRAGQSEKGYSQPKILVENDTQKNRLTRIGRPVRMPVFQEAF